MAQLSGQTSQSTYVYVFLACDKGGLFFVDNAHAQECFSCSVDVCICLSICLPVCLCHPLIVAAVLLQLEELEEHCNAQNKANLKVLH